MTIENQPVERGQVLLYPVPGKITTYRHGQVMDIQESVKAVKLSFAVGSTVRSQWFAASVLRRTKPS